VRFLVTGASGFIGGRLSARLAADGHEVRALVRDPEAPGATRLRAPRITLEQGDVTDRATLHAPMRGVDGVFHLAAARVAPIDDAGYVQRVNVDGTRNVLETMRDTKTPRGVHTSALAVNGDTRGQLVDEHYRGDWPLAGDYERSKREAQREIAEPMMSDGLPLVVTLPGMVYGPGDRSAVRDTFRQYLRGELPMIPRNTAYCWTHVDDCVDAHIKAMLNGRPGESYIVSGPVYTFVEAFEIAERITGIAAPTMRVAPGVLRLAAAMLGVVDDTPPAPRWGRNTRPVTWGVSQLGNDAKARRELGFDPRPLEVGLRETLLHEMRLLGLATPE
jgi:nucleoside-diphosphate-sugar epimerase